MGFLNLPRRQKGAAGALIVIGGVIAVASLLWIIMRYMELVQTTGLERVGMGISVLIVLGYFNTGLLVTILGVCLGHAKMAEEALEEQQSKKGTKSQEEHQ